MTDPLNPCDGMTIEQIAEWIACASAKVTPHGYRWEQIRARALTGLTTAHINGFNQAINFIEKTVRELAR